VYSLGATLYAALAAYIPEDGLARAMEEVKLTPLRKRNSKVSARVAAAIEKAMEPSQPNRFQTAEDFKRALLGVEPAQPEPAKSDTVPPPPVYRPVEEDETPRPASRRKNNALSLALLIAIIFAFGSFAGWWLQNPESAPEVLRVWFPLSPTPAFTATLTPQPTASPSPLPSLTITSTHKPTETRTLPPTATSTVGAALITNPPSQPSATASITATETLIPTQAATLTPAPTPAGGGAGEIAFVAPQANTMQVFLASVDGANTRQLTSEMGGACQPAWSPDGMQLVFVSPCYDKSDQYPQSGLYILNLETNEIQPLPGDPAGDFEPAWSPDGGKIAFTSLRDGNQPQIFALNLADLSVEQLTNSNGSNIQARHPAWSPDGSEIAYTVRRLGLLQIWLMLADGSNPTQLVRNGGSFSDYLPAWSPDGTYILFSQTNTSLTSPSSLQKIVPGAPNAELLAAPIPVVDVSFSPDGVWVAYESAVSQNQDIYLYNLETGERIRLTSSTTVDFDPAWRP
jgi:hypothetical protein